MTFDLVAEADGNRNPPATRSGSARHEVDVLACAELLSGTLGPARLCDPVAIDDGGVTHLRYAVRK